MSGTGVTAWLRSDAILPLARAVKARLRDLWWQTRGPRLGNPTVPSGARRLLFVCKGNICRSPLAEVMAQRLAREAGLSSVICSSAGFAASPGDPSPRDAIEAAARLGLTLDAHRARLLTEELMGQSDLIVVMEAAHVSLLHARFPRHAGRVFLLPLFGTEVVRGRGYRRFNIADPYNRSLEVFESCYAYIQDSLAGLMGALGPRAR